MIGMARSLLIAASGAACLAGTIPAAVAAPPATGLWVGQKGATQLSFTVDADRRGRFVDNITISCRAIAGPYPRFPSAAFPSRFRIAGGRIREWPGAGRYGPRLPTPTLDGTRGRVSMPNGEGCTPAQGRNLPVRRTRARWVRDGTYTLTGYKGWTTSVFVSGGGMAISFGGGDLSYPEPGEPNGVCVGTGIREGRRLGADGAFSVSDDRTQLAGRFSTSTSATGSYAGTPYFCGIFDPQAGPSQSAFSLTLSEPANNGAPLGRPPGAQTQGPGPDPADRAGCRAYEIVGVRGSGEGYTGPFGMSETVGNTVRAIVAALPRGSARTTSLRYPAAPVSELAFNNGETFFTSIAIGQRALVRRVLERIRRCKRTRFALVGYSQGAAVASGGLRRLLDEQPERVREALGAVVLYADPYSAGPGSSYDISLTAFGEPTSARIGHGALGAQTFRLGIKLSRVRDVCFAGDLVCDLSGNSALALYQALFAPIHSNYKSCCPVFPLTHLQGRWAARRLRAR